MLTYNEEKNITDCINSFKHFVDRIVIWDGFSQDHTVEIAKKLGAEVYQHHGTYRPRYDYGMAHTKFDTDWIAFIEADERFTEVSAKELKYLCDLYADTDTNGIVLRDTVCFMGKELRHGGVYPLTRLRVWKPGKGYMEKTELDEHIIVKEGNIAYMKHDILHTDYNGLLRWSSKHCEYASRAAKDYLRKKTGIDQIEKKGVDKRAKIKRFFKYHIYYQLPMGIRAWMLYIYQCYIRFGFLDGKEGKIYAFLHAYWYRYLVDAYIYESQKAGNK